MIKRLRPVMKTRMFDGTNLIGIIGFLATLKRQMDQSRISEGAAMLVVPEFLGDAPRALFDANFDVAGDGTGAFRIWPE